MPGTIRPNRKMAKLVYKINKVPKSLQQSTKQKPPIKERKMWIVDNPMN